MLIIDEYYDDYDNNNNRIIKGMCLLAKLLNI